MSDHSDVAKNQPQIDSRANLFYLLQQLSGLAGQKADKDTSVSNKQIETHQNQKDAVI